MLAGNKSPINEFDAGAGGLAHAHGQPQRAHLPEVLSKARQRGEQAPYRDTDAENSRAVSTVGPPPQRHAHDGIKQQKRGAEPGQLRITQFPIEADLFAHRCQDHAVVEIQQVDGEQYAQRKPCLTFGHATRLCIAECCIAECHRRGGVIVARRVTARWCCRATSIAPARRCGVSSNCAALIVCYGRSNCKLFRHNSLGHCPKAVGMSVRRCSRAHFC